MLHLCNHQIKLSGRNKLPLGLTQGSHSIASRTTLSPENVHRGKDRSIKMDCFVSWQTGVWLGTHLCQNGLFERF